MATIKASTKTIHDILFQLGSPQQLEVGHQADGHIMGQVIETKREGVESHTPEAFDYIAEVQEVKNKKVWKVIELKAIHIDPQDTLIWPEDY